MKKACFTGHRPHKFSFGYEENHPDCAKIKKSIKDAILISIEDGYDYFISGMALGVDTWAAEAVLEMKEEFPNIKLEVAIPCAGQEKRWRKEAQERYSNIVKKADIIYHVSTEVYQSWLMIKRDEYMIDSSDRVIAVYDGTPGGTQKTFDYGIKKNKEWIKIDPKSFTITKDLCVNQKLDF